MTRIRIIRAQRRFPTRPQGDQQAGDDAHVRLNIDPVGTVADQVTAPQHVLEESKECFNLPRTLHAKRQLLAREEAGQ